MVHVLPDSFDRGASRSSPRRSAFRAADIVPDQEVNAGLRRIFDRLQGEPALVVTGLGETLLQTPSAVALLGDETVHAGLMRVRAYPWFTDSAARRNTPVEDQALHSRALVAQLASVTAGSHRGSRADHVVDVLRQAREEFAPCGTSNWSPRPNARRSALCTTWSERSCCTARLCSNRRVGNR